MRRRRDRWAGVAVGLVIVMLEASCQGSDADLVAVARSFPAPAEWTQLEQRDVSEPTCLGPHCTTVVVRWAARSVPAGADLEGLMQQAGWERVSVSACQPRPNVTGPVPFCSASAGSDGANIELTVAGPLPGADPWWITLRVKH